MSTLRGLYFGPMETCANEGAPPGMRQIFGNAVRDARQRKGWTQLALAEQLKRRGTSFTQTMVAKVERGARPTPVEEAALFADVLEVPIGELFVSGGPTAATNDLRAALHETRVWASRLEATAEEYNEAREALAEEVRRCASYVQLRKERSSSREALEILKLLNEAHGLVDVDLRPMVERSIRGFKGIVDNYGEEKGELHQP